MITQESYIQERRRMRSARTRFANARRAVPPNPYARGTDGMDLLDRAIDAAAKLESAAISGLERFEREGYPDDWRTWINAADDAREWLQRNQLVRDRIPAVHAIDLGGGFPEWLR